MKRLIRQLKWRWILIGALLIIEHLTPVWAGTQVSTNIYDDSPATTNVGIGTTSPQMKLDVNGRIHSSSGEVFSGASGFNASFRLIGENNWDMFHNETADKFYIRRNSIEYLSIAPGGNVGIGTTSPATKLHVAGDAQVDGNLAAKYQDVAEWVKTSSSLPQGTVVVIDPYRHDQILPASQSYDTRGAGVVSARPGLLLGEAGPDKVKVAQSGRVKVKVDAAYGPIAAGDLLVTSPTPGHAMRSSPVKLGKTLIHRPGTLLGKALEPLEEGQGEILVLLTLQ